MKSKLRSRFQRGGENNKDKDAFNIEVEGKVSRCDTLTATSIVNVIPNNVYTLNLQDYPEMHTPTEENATVSTITNDGAFSQKRFHCGIDFECHRNLSSLSSLTNDDVFSQKRFNCGFDPNEQSTMREQMRYKNQGIAPNSTRNLSSLSFTTSSSLSQVHLMACGASVASVSVDSKDSIFDRVLKEQIDRMNAMSMGRCEEDGRRKGPVEI